MKRLLPIFVALVILLTSLSPIIRVAAADPVEIITIESPTVVGLGQSICFKVTVKVNEGQLLESRGDMLRNTDGNLFGHWPHIAVVGTVHAGQLYTFSCYTGMVAPTVEGTYESKWRVWRDGSWVGTEIVVRFTVKNGSGTPPYESRMLTYQDRCDGPKPTTGDVEDQNGKHYYIDYVIPGSTGTSKVVMDNTTHEAQVSITSWQLKLATLGKLRVGPFQVGPFSFGPYTVGPERIHTNGPGANEGPPGNTTQVPADHWHIFIPERILLKLEVPFLGNVGVLRDAYKNDPGSLVHLRCNFTIKTVPDRIYYPLQNGIAIAAPQVGQRYIYPYHVPSWMTSASIILRKGSDATITLRGPDGRIYGAAHPQVEYTNTPQYAILKLKQPDTGQWEALIDVTAAQPDSVFFLSIGGTYGTPTNPDITAPFTSISIDAAHGNNSWLVSDARITLSAEDAGGAGLAKIEWSIDGGTSWSEYSTPVIISQEGLTVFTARATDNTGNLEILPPTKYIRIDKTVPAVNIWTNATTYTRVDSLVIHYNCSDKTPGSGLVSCTGTFNEHLLDDGQSVDLFWLDLDNHVIYANSEDFAGWLTERNTTFEMLATIESLQATVKRLCTEHYINRKGICNSLSQKLDAVLAARNRGQVNAAINILQALQNEVSAQEGKGIMPKAAHILQMDSNYVIQSFR